MKEYIKGLQICIDSKLQSFAMNEGFSIIDLHILYHHQLQQVQNMYRIPTEHESKIMTIAYNQAISKIYKVKK